MKRLLTFIFALALCANLSFAQAGSTGGTTDQSSQPTEKSGKKAHKGGKKSHKGGKKSKKGSGDTSTTPPPK